MKALELRNYTIKRLLRSCAEPSLRECPICSISIVVSVVVLPAWSPSGSPNAHHKSALRCRANPVASCGASPACERAGSDKEELGLGTNNPMCRRTWACLEHPERPFADGGSFSRTQLCTGLTSLAGFCWLMMGSHAQNAVTGKFTAFTKKYQWAGREDSNLRPIAPQPSALPG